MSKKKITVNTVPYDKVAEIKVSGAFYERLTNLFEYYAASKSSEELAKAVEAIKAEKAHEDIFHYNIETFMILIRSLDIAYNEAGALAEQEIELDVEEKSEDEPKS